MTRPACLALVLTMGFSARPIAAQTPQVGQVLNAASYAQPAVLAPGVIFSIFGASLTNGATAGSADTPLPTRLAGARLLVNGVPAPLFYASPRQINGQFPVELTGLTTATMQVEVESATGTLTSPPISVPVAIHSPGILTQDQNGSGPGVIFRASDFRRICPPVRFDCTPNPAAPGETITIFLTGLGPVNGTWSSGEPAQSALPTVTTPTVSIGALRAQVQFSGLATGYVGLYQVNVTVPATAPAGHDVPLTLSIGGARSNPVTIYIEPSGAPPVLPPGGGPPGARVTSLAMDPRNPQTLYAGTDDGIFKTTNGGRNWSDASSWLGNRGIMRLAIDPSNPATLYAMTYSGMFKSTDGAASWRGVNNGLCGGANTPPCSGGRLPFGGGSVLAIDPLNPSTLYLGLRGPGIYGLFKTTDGAASWTPANNGFVPGVTEIAVYSLAVDPSHPTTLYAEILASPQGTGHIFKSIDGAAGWTELAVPLPLRANFPTLAVDPLNSSIVVGATSGGIFKSTDAGASWAQVNVDFGLVEFLVMDPGNPATIYAGGSNGVVKSTDGGATWAATGLTRADTTHLFSLALDPSNAATLYGGGVMGVFKSTDAAANWALVNNGITAAQVSALAVDRSNPATLYVGTVNAGTFRSTNGGASWKPIHRGLARYVRAIAMDPSNSAIVYAGTGGAGPGDGVYKSADGGASWTGVWNGTGRGVRALAIAPSNAAVLYVATGGSGVFKSTDGGASWNQVTIVADGFFSDSQRFTNTFFCALAIDPVNPNTVYAGACGGESGGGVLKSTDGGASWTVINNGLRTPDQTFFVSSLVINPVNPATLYVVAAGSIFKSTNAGESWTPANSGLPATSVGALAIDPANPAILYVVTNSGVFKSTDGGESWTASGNSGLRRLPSTLAIGTLAGSTTIYGGTLSSGVYRSTDGGATWQPTSAIQD